MLADSILQSLKTGILEDPEAVSLFTRGVEQANSTFSAAEIADGVLIGILLGLGRDHKLTLILDEDSRKRLSAMIAKEVS